MPRDPFQPGGINPAGADPDASGASPWHSGAPVVVSDPTLTPLEGDVVHRDGGDRVLAGTGSLTVDIQGEGVDEISFLYTWAERPDGRQELRLVAQGQGASRLLAEADGAPAALPPGQSVGPALPEDTAWSAAPLLLAGRTVVGGEPQPWHGPWVGTSRGLLGLRLSAEHGARYGWIRLSLDRQTGHLTLHDYAFRLTPGAGIAAGE